MQELPTQAYPDGGGLNGGLQWTGEPGHMINTASGEVDSYVHPEYANATYDHDDNPGTPEVSWPKTYQRYATACRRIDDGVGDIVQLLKDLDAYENTIIVFTSDNGPSREDYLPEDEYVRNTPDFFNSFGPFDGIKRDTWEGGLREPTIVSWPARIPADQVIDEPSAMYDWMTTLAEAAGIPVPARSDGVSLLPLLTGARDSVEHKVYVEYFNNRPTPSYAEFLPSHRGRQRNQMQMIRLGDFAGVRYDIQSAEDDFEIYNVAEDPQQSRDLGSDAAYGSLQALMKKTVLPIRRPNESAPRPYDGAPIPGMEPSLLKRGVRWSAYPGDFPWVADVAGRAPAAEGVVGAPDASVIKEAGVLSFEGVIEIPEDGEYRFSLEADGPFVMRLHEALLLDAGYGNDAGREISASARLSAGFHPFRVYLKKAAGSDGTLDLRWGRSGGSAEAVPAGRLFHQ